jgi:hypothetical protein
MPGYPSHIRSELLIGSPAVKLAHIFASKARTYDCIQKVSDKLELNIDRHRKPSRTISKAGWVEAYPGTPSMPRRLFRESHRLAARRSFARRCFCVRPCFDLEVGSAPFPLFSRVILAPVFGCANPGPTTFFNLNHEIKLTDRAVQADDQSCSGHP